MIGEVVVCGEDGTPTNERLPFCWDDECFFKPTGAEYGELSWQKWTEVMIRALRHRPPSINRSIVFIRDEMEGKPFIKTWAQHRQYQYALTIATGRQYTVESNGQMVWNGWFSAGLHQQITMHGDMPDNDDLEGLVIRESIPEVMADSTYEGPAIAIPASEVVVENPNEIWNDLRRAVQV